MKKLIVVLLCLLVMASSVMAYSSGRTQIVKLCEKDTTTWECQKGIKSYDITPQGGRKPVKYADGLVRYKSDDLLSVYLSTSYLDQDQVYQVALVGQGGTPTDDLLAMACDNPNQGAVWECGYWNGNQGFYNFYIGTLGELRKTRYGMQDLFNIELPSGAYNDVKFLVKQNEAPWNTYLFEEETLNFMIG